MVEYEFRIDPDKNRLYITLAGSFQASDVDATYKDLERELSKMQPGFDVITDLTRFKPGSPSATDGLRKGAELIRSYERRHAVRVSGRFITGVLQFNRVLRGLFSQETTLYATSLEEAEQILDKLAAQSEA